jgi:transcriptional antiterminator RfaH
MSHWHAVLCKPRREAVAEANLRNQGFDVYLPRMVGLRRRAGRWEHRIEPLFPRYLFLNAGEGGRGLASVRSTLGVSGLVRSCGAPARVPPGVVEALRESADPATGCHRFEVAPFAAGARVRFAAGPLAGLEGVFEMASADARVVVLLDFLGKTNRLTVNRDWLVAAP